MVSSVTAVLLFLRVEERQFGVDLKGLDGALCTALEGGGGYPPYTDMEG
jgi:hypothetical protein